MHEWNYASARDSDGHDHGLSPYRRAPATMPSDDLLVEGRSPFGDASGLSIGARQGSTRFLKDSVSLNRCLYVRFLCHVLVWMHAREVSSFLIIGRLRIAIAQAVFGMHASRAN